ncbi:MAG: methylmalonyl-CoA mutase, partial [Proteobacteria bacterium]|nr:methylmalonyl-CoA mutase [Pseudomonadota bacterium]
ATPLEPAGMPRRAALIPGERVRYLAEIADAGRRARAAAQREAEAARRAEGYRAALEALGCALLPAAWERYPDSVLAGSPPELARLRRAYNEALEAIGEEGLKLLRDWPARAQCATDAEYTYVVRGRELKGENYTESLSQQRIPKLAVPRFLGAGDRLLWLKQENLPGDYPYTGGVYPYRREQEDPTRMFAGEGLPERTNKRFHYLAAGSPAKRLSTAFDSATLYGEDPDERPDIYGRIGNSGVSIATLDDMKRLYSGFDLCAPTTSVSMTINGPAPILLAMYMNTAIDQRVERHLREAGRLDEVERTLAESFPGGERPAYRGALPDGNDGYGLALLGSSAAELVARGLLEESVAAALAAEALGQVRGTVQADILKEDQAQNTCIFSTEFAMRMMGDVQAYF